MFSNLQIRKFISHVMKQMNVLMSYTHGRRVSLAIHSQPLCLLSVVKYIFGLDTVEEDEEVYKCYDKLLSHVPSFGFNQIVRIPERTSYEQLLVQELGYWQYLDYKYPIQTLLPLLMKMTNIPFQLQKEFVSLCKSIDESYKSVDFKRLVQILMSLEPQGLQHQLAVEKCFINAKLLGYNIDEDFIQPILD